MASTNHECVGKAVDLLKDGLQPFVDRVEGKGSDTNVCHNQVTEPDSRDQDLSSRSSGRH